MTKHENYLQKVKKVNPDFVIISNYKGAAKPITYICPICEKETTIKNAANLYRKETLGCRQCFLKNLQAQRTEKAKQKAINKIDRFEGIELLKSYSKERLYFDLSCRECGYEWTVLGNNINKTKWKGCPECWSSSEESQIARLIGLEKSRKKELEITDKKLTRWASENDIVVLEKKKQSLKLMCNKCGDTWNTQTGHVFGGKGGCSVCLGSKYNISAFKEKLKELKRFDLKVISKEHSSYVKMKFVCMQEDCKHEWETRSTSVIKGSGCPLCATSRGNRRIANTLRGLGIDYEIEKTFDACKNKNALPFDAYVESHNLLIEYDGVQHFEAVDFFGGKEHFEYRQVNDEIKNKFCEENGIELLRIPYWEFNNIEDIIIEQIKKGE